MSSEIIELTDEQASVLKPDGAQHLSEADRIALTKRTNIERVLRKIANRHIAQDYPTTVAAGLEPRLEARGNADVWTLPLVYASAGYGDDGIVCDVGSIMIDSRTGTVVEVTPRDEVVAMVRKLHEENREAIEAAFYSAAAQSIASLSMARQIAMLPSSSALRTTLSRSSIL